MSEGMQLSQDEIDALLGGNSSNSTPSVPQSEGLTDAERDALGEVGNICFGSAATSLSTLLRQRVEITTPEVSVLQADQVSQDFPRPYVMVSVDFTEGLTGSNALAIEINDAKTIADLMMGGDGHNIEGELNELHLSAVGEAMNQMMGGAATAMSTMFGRPINISPPRVQLLDLAAGDTTEIGLPDVIVNTSFRLGVGDLIDSRLMQLVPVSFAKELLSMLNGASQEAAATAAPERPTAVTTAAPSPAPASQPMAAQTVASSVNAPGPQMQAATQGMPMSAQGGAGQGEFMGAPGFNPQSSVMRPDFTDFGGDAVAPANSRNLSLLLDVSLNVTVELGRTKKAIRDILDLAPGSVLELDKLAGEPVDILVNNKRVAIGEVVVIDENFGVRVTDIISQAERVKNLQ